MSPQEPLTVECPRCHTRFRAREDQLAAAGGQVRCGICLALFDASHATPAGPAESTPPDVDEADDPSPAGPTLGGRQGQWRRTLLLCVGAILAAAALAFQVLAYQFDRWALDPQFRFIYEFGCGVMGCELPDPPGQDVGVTLLDRGASLR